MALPGTKSNPSTCRQESYKRVSEAFGQGVRHNVPLAPYTTFGIGGKADLFYTAKKPEELIYAVRTAQKLKYPYVVLGGGSNVLVSDAGFRGVVIKNECRRIWVNHDSITCQSGASLDEVVNLACEHALSGLEFSAGIPGTVGGAVRGNAGAYGRAVGDVLCGAVILTRKGEIKEVGNDYFQFGYRESILKKTEDILLSATFKLKKQNKKKIEKKIEEYLRKREENLPLKEKSAGCFFKNVILNDEKIPAGFLLEQIGAKGMQKGGAKVFTGHANILINGGDATAEDVVKLAGELKRRVKRKFGIHLEEEIVYIN